MIRKSTDNLISAIKEDIIRFIAGCDELMFNERDFQMKLAVSLLATGAYDDVEVEYFIPNSVAKAAGYEWSSDLRLDLVVRKGDEYVPIELKYPTRRVVTDIHRFGRILPGVEIVKNQGAQDIVMYNFWKDVRRVEVIRNLFPRAVKGGLSVMLTNDGSYVRGPRPGTIHSAFSVAGGRTSVTGTLAWVGLPRTAVGKPPFTLDGKYSVAWHNTTIANQSFYYTIITI